MVIPLSSQTSAKAPPNRKPIPSKISVYDKTNDITFPSVLEWQGPGPEAGASFGRLFSPRNDPQHPGWQLRGPDTNTAIKRTPTLRGSGKFWAKVLPSPGPGEENGKSQGFSVRKFFAFSFFCVLFFDLNIGFSFSGGNLRSQKESGRTVFGWWGGGEREASRKSWELFGQSLSTWVEMKSKQRDEKFSEGEI